MPRTPFLLGATVLSVALLSVPQTSRADDFSDIPGDSYTQRYSQRTQQSKIRFKRKWKPTDTGLDSIYGLDPCFEQSIGWFFLINISSDNFDHLITIPIDSALDYSKCKSANSGGLDSVDKMTITSGACTVKFTHKYNVMQAPIRGKIAVACVLPVTVATVETGAQVEFKLTDSMDNLMSDHNACFIPPAACSTLDSCIVKKDGSNGTSIKLINARAGACGNC